MAGERTSLTARICEWLIRWRWVLLAASLVLTAVGFWPSTQLSFDAAITNLFPPDDPVLVAYEESLKVFGGAELVVVAYSDPELLTPEGLRRLEAFADTFRDLEPLGVQQVGSLAGARWPPAPLDSAPLYEQAERRGLSREELKRTLLAAELYRDVFLGKDGQTTAIALTLRPKRDDLERKDLIAGIRRRAEANRFRTVVAGGPILTHDASMYVDEDSRTLGWVSTVALLLMCGLLFRRLRWMILPLAVVHVTLVWTKALLWLFAAQLSMVSTTLTALVTVIGVATVVQVTARYREERERADVRGALKQTMVTAGPAVFWASLTTAAGFASLLITSIVPVRNFAVMLALASMLVFFVTAALVPGVILWGRRPSDPVAMPAERQLERLLEATMDWSLRRPIQVGIIVTVLIVFTFAGIFRIQAETDFTRNFRQSSDVVVAYRFVEERLGAVGTMSLEFAAPDGLTPELINRLRKLEARLRENPELDKVLGLVDVLDFLDAGPTAAMSQLLGARFSLNAKLAVLNSFAPDIVPGFWNATEHEMRLLLRAREQAPSEVKDALIAWIERTAREELELAEDPSPPTPRPASGERGDRAETVDEARKANEGRNEGQKGDEGNRADVTRNGREDAHGRADGNTGNASGPTRGPEVRVTGTYTLLNHLVSGLMADQLNTFLLATAAVFSIMCLALRSIKLGVVGLVPKIGPILMVLGAMGWLGVPIDMGTPMIASVSLGISVGFSIHYLYRYRQERAAGVPFDAALRATHRRVGGAMVFANLALVVGFGVLTLSNFIPTVHFSILADVALVGGLAGNLLVLPLLLKWVSARDA